MKGDTGKPPIHLIPSKVLLGIASVFGFGAEKYGENNWRDDVNNTTFGRTYSSIQRHLFSFWSGEDFDEESKLHHLDHAITQLMILRTQTLEMTNPDIDDRYKVKDES